MRSLGRALLALSSIALAGSTGCGAEEGVLGADAEDPLTSPCTSGRRELSGTVGSQSWTTCSIVLTGPLRVEGDLSIRSGVDIEVPPRSDGIPYVLVVRGRVRAVGTETGAIRLHARGEVWSGVNVESSGSELTHVVFDRASAALKLHAGANRLAHVTVLRAQASGIHIARAWKEDPARLDEQITDYRFEGDVTLAKGTVRLDALTFFGPGAASVTRAFVDDCPSSACPRVQPRADADAAASFGIVATEGVRLLVEDSVLFGKEKDTAFDVHERNFGPRLGAQYAGADIYGAGIWTAKDSSATVERSVIAGYGMGVRAQGGELLVEDATLVRNDTGVQFETPDGGATSRCPRPRPSVPPKQPLVPVAAHITRSDLRFNDRRAVYHRASALLRIEESNIVDNRGGVLVDTDEIASGSALVRDDIHSNETLLRKVDGSGAIADWRTQVWTLHATENFELSSNYWGRSVRPEVLSNPHVVGAWYVGGAGSDCRKTGPFTVTSAESAPVAAGPHETDLLPAVRVARERVMKVPGTQ